MTPGISKAQKAEVRIRTQGTWRAKEAGARWQEEQQVRLVLVNTASGLFPGSAHGHERARTEQEGEGSTVVKCTCEPSSLVYRPSLCRWL